MILRNPAKSVTFLTAATGAYSDFILPYIAFVLCTQEPGTPVEVWTDDRAAADRANGFLANHPELGLFPEQVFVLCPRSSLRGDFLRFLIRPQNCRWSRWTYIGDVDMMPTCPDMMDYIMEHTPVSFPYFNSVREVPKGKPSRLTGLHCVLTDHWYPRTQNYRHKILQADDPGFACDEAMLYHMASMCGCVTMNTERPQFGIHLCEKREPNGVPGWGVKTENYAKGFVRALRHPTMDLFARAFSDRVRRLMDRALGAIVSIHGEKKVNAWSF